MSSFVRLVLKPKTLFLLFYPLLDLLVSMYPSLGVVGYGWLLCVYLLVFVLAGRTFWALVGQAREERQWWTVGTVVVWWLFILAAAFSERLLSDENIFEVGCPQNTFRHAADFGFLDQCFIGYPTRSYLLQALPVLLFGFSPSMANLGASLLLFPGIVLLAQAIRIVTQRARASDFITGLAMLLLFQCSVLIRIIYYHDQTTQPVAITMILMGLLALWLDRLDRSAFFALLALVLVSTSMYPPILSVLCLLGVLLLWMLFRKELPAGDAGPLLMTGFLAVVCFVQTLAYRLDMRIGVDTAVVGDVSGRLWELATFIVTQSNGMGYAALPFQALFLLFLVGGLLGLFGLFAFIFSVWSVALIVVSFFASGMSSELTWYFMTGMHRTAPIFPLFALFMAFGLSKRVESYRLSRGAMTLLLVFVVGPGVWTVYRFPIPDFPPLSFRVWQVAQRVTPPGVRPEPTLITRNDIPALGELPKHYLYLNPERTFKHYAGTCLPQEPVPPYTLVVTKDDEVCQQQRTREGFEEVAAWGEFVGGELVYNGNTIRVYRATPRTP